MWAGACAVYHRVSHSRKTLASHRCGHKPTSILLRGVEICLDHSHVLKKAESGSRGVDYTATRKTMD